MSFQDGSGNLHDAGASDASTTPIIEPTTGIQLDFSGISPPSSTDSVPTDSANGLRGTVAETTPSPGTAIRTSFEAASSTGSSVGTFHTSKTRSCEFGECSTISSNASTVIPSASVSFPGTSTSTVSPTAIANATPSSSPSHHGLSQSSKIAAIVVPILVLLVLVPACIFCFIIRRNRRRHRSLRGTVEMKNVSPSSYEAPPHQMSVNHDLPPLPPQQFAQTTTSHTIPRRPLARNSAYYTGIGQEAADRGHDHPPPDTRSATTAPPGYTNPNSPGLTEQNLLNHTVYGDRPPPGERTRSPFEDEDVVSNVSHTGAETTRRRDVDEESVVSALDESAVEKKGGGGGRHDDDNESVVSALDDEHVERTSGSHGPVKVMNERTLHLD